MQSKLKVSNQRVKILRLLTYNVEELKNISTVQTFL